MISKTLDRLVEADAFIASVDQVVGYVKDDHNIDVKPWTVSEVMRKVGLRYKKIRKTPLKGNCS